MPEQDRSIRRAPRCAASTAILTALALIAGPSLASGQPIKFNLFQKPKVQVLVGRPPSLGVDLTAMKVAFGQVTGTCGQQFADLMMQDFIRHRVTVVNRGDLDAILSEHHFQVSASVDPATAVQLGKVLGPAIMVFVNVSRCEARKREPLVQDTLGLGRVNISRTEGHFLASIHTVDLATGRELAVNTLQSDPHRDNQSQTGIPEYPGEYEVQDQALQEARTQAIRLYFSWTDAKEVSFMNAKDCNLKQAYDLLKANDFDGALKTSLTNVETCKADPKVNHQADAWYNLGVAYMLAQKYDDALDALGHSQRLHSDKAVLETLAECREAKTAFETLAVRQQAAADEHNKQKDDIKTREEQVAKSLLTNETVIKLVRGSMSEDVVIKMIAGQKANFSLLPDDLLALKQAGVPDKVIAAMLDKK